MRALQFISLIIFFIFLITCDTTEPSFDDSIPDYYSFTTNVSPANGGTIQPTDGEYDFEDEIFVEAYPADGYVFERWEDDLTGNTNPETLVFTENKTVTAIFAERDYPLNIDISGEGVVNEVLMNRADTTVDTQNMSTPGNDVQVDTKKENGHRTQRSFKQEINLKETKTGSSGNATPTIRLTAVPENGWYFDQWEGDLTGSVNPEDITVDEEKNVTAVFLQEDTDGYSVTINIEGEGSVNKEPDRNYFNEGDEVTLTADPSTGWNFVEWQEDLTGSDNSQTFVINEDVNVTAIFEETDDPAMEITQQPSGTIAGNAVSPAPQIRLTDGFGDPIDDTDITVRVNNNSFTSGSSTTVPTNSDGLASFDNLIIETASSGYILTFDADMQDVSNISTNPFGVFAAEADPANSSAIVPDGLAGEETEITISVVDEFGNAKEDVTGDLSAEVTGANDMSLSINETGTSGEYVASYLPENSGTDRITIQLGDQQINGSPFESEVNAANADPSNSTATIPDGVAGEETVLTIYVKDNFNNSVSNIAGDLTVEISGANNASPSVNETDTSGVYVADYTPENSGTDQIRIELSGSQIDGSPFESEVTPAQIDPSSSSVTVEPAVLKVGENSLVTIELRDNFENPIGGLNEGDFSIEIGGDASAESVRETSSNGTYEFEITNTTAEEITVSVSAKKVTLEDTPNVTFEPGSIDELVIVTQPEDTRSGQPIEGPPAVKVNDEYGNGIAGIDVKVREQNGNEFYSGDLTVTTNQSGRAVFNDLVLNRVFGNFTLIFSAPGVSEITSESFELSPFN